ncbi:MAG: Uma2 family endonuclease [Chroococcidiopsidaceae cyanobacterium CP_BM_RX_35]|nr:Uma2 family endonuclease [Chroococcidiopsidaceae cyanobacterium CP_BM_RX_35]
MTLASPTLPTNRLWTVEEYHHMVDVGIILPDERVELIEGEIVSMAAKKPPHVIVTELAAEYLRQLLASTAHIRTQDPIVLDERNEPEPDIAVVMPPLRRYLDHHPTSHEIFLIIEVADATLKFDTEKKAATYAKSAIADYWVIDASAHQVHVFRAPVNGAYTNHVILNKFSSIRPLAFPEITVIVQEFFP